ncbi:MULTISPECIES: TIR domain-containing protein [unclassified Leptolyngbya]|uniref:TIR domain-containing protein n=1 Tax=unclassified Leptolyngbya TaxID=2650499 RepID=UPI00168741B4|nr:MULTISPECIES: TIR domain-containing protein [unclassified Leptolyngbya]MBD1913776.1 TIR domain-containing protein [Leptolyngbya sp. FACHB-8]MBD2156140.1 TIR domain-containing protein [Leptolyngbya sp. FACHB-16]
MTEFQDAFISYGRIDSKEFVIRLHERLQQEGVTAWFDQTDIPLGVNFQTQIDTGIEQADSFLFIISPHAVNSPYCLKEIQMAVLQNKRIIPLLHVEEISRDTWQERYPTGTGEEWDAYRAKGLHSSSNMHPEISKINWVYFREGVDDFERSLRGLLDLFHRHQDYVHQHTVLLTKALEWERHQKQSQYLLVEEERMEAEFWLTHRFKGEQPPCEPTDLHCEFICESIKNANNLMTQVFLCHTSEEYDIADSVSKTLMRERFTIWASDLSRRGRINPWNDVRQGIERADHVVCFLSPSFNDSEDCLKQMAYAFELNKPIIAIRLRSTTLSAQRKRGMVDIYNRLGVGDENSVLNRLKSLPVIHLVPQEIDAAEYQTGIDMLLCELNKESAYHEQHKMLLVRALRWHEQGRQPSLLLRGHNLQKAKAWLASSKSSDLQPPVALQEELIATSLEQPPQISTAAFLSYSPVDSDFARKLNNALQDQGRSTWFDQDAIVSGSDIEKERKTGIETADNFVIVLSPSAVRSPRCQEELAYAEALNKRIVPLFYQAVEPDGLPSAVANRHAIDFTKKTNFLVNLGSLMTSLDTDQEYLRMHTRLQVRAMEWKAEGRDNSFLLRGKDLAGAARWFEQSATQSPPATALQTEFIAASQSLPSRRVKLRTVAVTSVAATALVAIARFMGMLQGVELAAYDAFLRARPSEPQDERFLMIGVDEPTLQFLQNQYEPGRGTIPDGALADMLKALEPGQPRMIGLDFYRDFAAEPELNGLLAQTPNLITVCKSSYRGWSNQTVDAIAYPPEVKREQVGFSDLLDDDQGDRYVRRHYLMQQSGDMGVCDTKEAFSLVLARRYLEAEGMPFTSPENAQGTAYQQDMVLGDRPIPQLLGTGAAYQYMDNQLRGYQTMLNYRTHNGSAPGFASMVSLKDVIQGKVPAEQIRDRIVLVGFTAPSSTAADFWNTPFGELPGVILQGQKTSQLISTVLDNRPLIWWWPLGLETVWTLAWGCVGGVVVWKISRVKLLALSLGLALASLYGISYVVFVFGSGWLPLVPPAIALLMAGAVVGYLNYRLRKI